MIVKNEESNLESSLASVSSSIDEIIIVDTGSTDKTKEIALKFTDKVYDYKWNNNFAAARNYSISKATNEYILVIDADEIIESIDYDKVIELIRVNPKKVGRLSIINEYSRKGIEYKQSEKISRLFSKKHFQYNGIIHEQIVSIENNEIETFDIPLIIKHLGYEGELEIRKKKTKRNIELLNMALKTNPNDPYLIYQLGKSYYMQEDYIKACDYFGKALYYDLDTGLEYVQDMVESYGYSLLNSEQYEIALQLMSVYDEFSHSADFIFMIALVLMNNGKFNEAIAEFIKATKIKTSKIDGVNSYRAYYNIGVIFECLGQIDKAKLYYGKCGDYGLALARLRE